VTPILQPTKTANPFQDTVFTLAGAPISWKAKKQSTTAPIHGRSEYAAMTQAIKEAIWLQNLLKDLRMSKYAPSILYCDNQGAIALAKEPYAPCIEQNTSISSSISCAITSKRYD
jgi:hypothetical protein